MRLVDHVADIFNHNSDRTSFAAGAGRFAPQHRVNAIHPTPETTPVGAHEWHLEKEPPIACVNLGDRAENLGSLAAFNEGKLEDSSDNLATQFDGKCRASS